MIIPDDFTLQELIDALRVEVNNQNLSSDEMMGLAGYLCLAEIVKRELDKKADRSQDTERSPDYCKGCLAGTHGV